MLNKYVLTKIKTFKSFYKSTNLNVHILFLYLLIESIILNNFKLKKYKYSHTLNGIDPYYGIVLIGFIAGWVIAKKYFNKD